MSRLRTTCLNETRCPTCSAIVDRASSTENARPGPGDLSVCAYCVGVSLYAEDMSLEAFDLSTLSASKRAEIEKMRDVVRRIQKARTS